jgi:hypothetical protein
MAEVKTVNNEATVKEERYTGVVPEVYKGIGKEQYNLVLTTKRIIFAFIKPRKDFIAPPSPDRYAARTSEEIRAEDKKNVVIDRDKVKSFEFAVGESYINCCNKLMEIDGQLHIQADKKYDFYVPYRRDAIARNVFGKAELIKA